MTVIHSIPDMKSFSGHAHAGGKSLGLIPTMGTLHDGHLSLIRQAKRQCDVIVVSIFVNPTQFGPAEDFPRYPRNLERDLEILKPFKVDAVFAPTTAEMYPEGFETFVEPPETARPLEGTARPGHFRGVATVVLKLFSIVRPHLAYFGQKDFQQALVVRRLIEDFNLDVRLVVCPTVREPDGLAMSSRNAYLESDLRPAALVLYRALRRAEDLAHAGETDTGRMQEEIRKVFATEPRVQVDYIAIMDTAQFKPAERVTPGCVALVAARVGPARLIDNLIFGPPGASPELLFQLALTGRPVADIRARIPGLEAEAVRVKVESCRDCAAVSSILLPPREFLMKYLKRDYPDLNAVRSAVIGRDAPMNREQFLYRNPEAPNQFVRGLYELLGVKDFSEFKQRFVLTDALRCHATGPRVPEKALEHCAKHVCAELKLFPNLDTIMVLGEDAYLQFQRWVLNRSEGEFKPFSELVKAQGWAMEEACLPALDGRRVRIIYCYHPTFSYQRSPCLSSLFA